MDIKSRVINGLQAALNRILTLDPELAGKMAELEGKIVAVELLGVGLTFHLLWVNQKLVFKLNDDTVEADTIIKGTPIRLSHMLVDKANRQHFFADDVAIEGDMELAQKIINLFDKMEIDWEEYLSHWVGDIAAHKVGFLIKQLKTWGQQTHATFTQNVDEYLHEEINLVPPREALNDFFHDIDAIRMDVDRIEARINYLQSLPVKRG